MFQNLRDNFDDSEVRFNSIVKELILKNIFSVSGLEDKDLINRARKKGCI
jgi:hypothetical protein